MHVRNKNKRDRADRIWRDRIWALFGGKCMMCHCSSPASMAHECHHLLGRGAWVRLKIIAGVLLCHECHRRVHDTAGGKAWIMDSIEARFPAWHRLLCDLKRKTGRYTNEDLDADLKTLKELEVRGTNGEVGDGSWGMSMGYCI